MRRASTLAAAALAASGVMALAGPASAQSPGQPAPTAGQAQGLRYLSWQGRGEAMPAARDTAQPEPPRADLRRPSRVIPHGGFAASGPPAPRRLSDAPEPARRTLTPANAWLQPRPVAPEPAPVPVSAAVAPDAPSAPPPPAAGPEYLPDQGRRGQPAPAEAVYPAAAPPAEGSSAPDPMAPRRDAPVFRMQQASPPPPAAAAAAAAQTAPPALSSAEAPQPDRLTPATDPDAAAPRQGGRYYSVHRQNGREPDALTMPAPTVVDALVVSGIDTLASQDLAEPAQGPTLIRDRNGSIRPAPAASDGDHQ
ncbi:hypothetical protein [Brevundimonas sp.]|uniref:hypothetical protein n=1 Tax=Brevundimonas sp. TaxID=1871086 RepID=UPI002ED7B6A5